MAWTAEITGTSWQSGMRNEWYTKVKTAINNAKASSAAYKSASMYKDDYQVQEDITSENL